MSATPAAFEPEVAPPKPRQHRVLIAMGVVAAVALVAAGATVLAASGPDGSTLRSPGQPGTSAFASVAVPAGQPYIMSVGDLCLDSGDPARIDSITATNVRGRIIVFDWGVRRLGPDTNYGDDYANHSGYLHKVMPGFNRKPVAVSCSHPHGSIAEIDVNIRHYAPIAVAKSFIVHYGDGKQAMLPFGLVVCSHYCPRIRPPSPWS